MSSLLQPLHLVTPDTLLRRHRELVAKKWDYSQRRGPGRARTMKTIVDLILNMALENRSWGYTRIRGALANLGHDVGRGTIANILHEHGIEPAPERDRHTRWSTFLKAHWECLTATDFLSVEVSPPRCLSTWFLIPDTTPSTKGIERRKTLSENNSYEREIAATAYASLF